MYIVPQPDAYPAATVVPYSDSQNPRPGPLSDEGTVFTKALVPLDNTEISEGIIPFVTQLAQGLDLDMEVVLATTVNLDHTPRGLFDRMRGVVGGSPPSTAEACPDQSEESAESDARNRLDELAGGMKQQGVSASSMVGFGPASETIIRMATDSNYDLIAMSTRAAAL